MTLIPTVVEQSSKGERAFDIFSRLLRDRIIFINDEIATSMSHVICAQLLLLESENKDEDIHIYINSPGGEVMAGLAIYDTMQLIKPDCATYVTGLAASMGSFLAQAGAKGKRFVLPESTTMIHRVSSGTQGLRGTIYEQELQKEDQDRRYAHSQLLNSRLTRLYAHHNTAGKTYEDLLETMKFDTWLTASDAVEYGLADVVLTHRA